MAKDEGTGFIVADTAPQETKDASDMLAQELEMVDLPGSQIPAPDPASAPVVVVASGENVAGDYTEPEPPEGAVVVDTAPDTTTADVAAAEAEPPA